MHTDKYVFKFIKVRLFSFRLKCFAAGFYLPYFSLQMYDQVASQEITLVNTGKVGFNFCCLNLDPALAKKPKPGVPIMVPHAVSRKAYEINNCPTCMKK